MIALDQYAVTERLHMVDVTGDLLATVHNAESNI